MTVNANPIDAHLFLLKHLVREYVAIGKHKLEMADSTLQRKIRSQ